MAARLGGLLEYGDKDDDNNDSGLSQKMMKDLLIEQASSDISTTKESMEMPSLKFVTPKPGFCLKTKTDKEEKIFINICKSSEIHSPKDITDEQLLAIMESGDAVNYRVPLSLGEAHMETDNAGKDCTVYDVIISDRFYDTVQERPVMKDFLLMIVLEGLEDKYNLRLCRDCRILKNRNYFGSIPEEQTVREKPKPFIIEVDKGNAEKEPAKISIPEPKYTIIREPVEGDIPEYLVFEVHLPQVSKSANIILDVGVDRVVLSARPNLYHMDVDLPFTVNAHEAGAQFDTETHVLSITLTVTGKADY